MVPKSRIKRVYNGASPMPTPSPFAPGSDVVFLYVGRLAPIKDHGTLIKAFSRLRNKWDSVRLVIVGDGPSRIGSQKLAAELGVADQIEFTGQQLDVSPFFARANVFVMSSLSEGVPMSLLQAMSVSMPSIVTDAGGMAEVVRLADCGLVVPVKDSNAYSEAMLRICTNAKERNRLGNNAHIAYLSTFTLDGMANSYEQLYSATNEHT